jgi:hypothetical protein
VVALDYNILPTIVCWHNLFISCYKHQFNFHTSLINWQSEQRNFVFLRAEFTFFETYGKKLSLSKDWSVLFLKNMIKLSWSTLRRHIRKYGSIILESLPADFASVKYPGTLSVGGCVGISRTRRFCGRKKSPPGFEDRTVQAVAIRYTNYAVQSAAV